MFSHLQLALSHHHDKTTVTLDQCVQDQLTDPWTLAQDITSRPTRIAEVIPTHPSFVGACDAAPSGFGGVWLSPTRPSSRTPYHPPIVWRLELPSCLREYIQSPSNPTGPITNNDLELAATLLHADTLASVADVRERTIATGCDNTAAVGWNRAGSVTSASPASYILRAASLHQRQHRYLHQVSYYPGQHNRLADDASRLFSLSDSMFLTHFNSVHQQHTPWQLHRPRQETISILISALLKTRQEPPSLKSVPPPKTVSGRSPGSPFANPWRSTPSFKPLTTKSPSYRSSLSECETDAAAGVVTRSAVIPWLTSYSPSPNVCLNGGRRPPVQSIWCNRPAPSLPTQRHAPCRPSTRPSPAHSAQHNEPGASHFRRL